MLHVFFFFFSCHFNHIRDRISWLDLSLSFKFNMVRGKGKRNKNQSPTSCHSNVEEALPYYQSHRQSFLKEQSELAELSAIWTEEGFFSFLSSLMKATFWNKANWYILRSFVDSCKSSICRLRVIQRCPELFPSEFWRMFGTFFWWTICHCCVTMETAVSIQTKCIITDLKVRFNEFSGLRSCACVYMHVALYYDVI